MRILIAILAFTTAAFIAFFDPAMLGGSRRPTLTPIGTIASFENEVSTKAPRTVQTVPVTSPRGFGAQEVVQTGPGSQAILELASGGRLRVFENARVVAEFEAGGQDRVIVTVLTGMVEILTEGTAGRLRVYKDGRLLTSATSKRAVPVIRSAPSTAPRPILSAPEESVTATQAEETAVATPTPAPIPKVLPKKVSNPTETSTLSNDEITRELASQGSRFQRCYLGFMQRSGDQNAKGTVTIAFIIANSGKVVSSRLVRSPFSDITLHNCLLEVVSRTQFPSFDAAPIAIESYPIQLQ